MDDNNQKEKNLAESENLKKMIPNSDNLEAFVEAFALAFKNAIDQGEYFYEQEISQQNLGFSRGAFGSMLTKKLCDYDPVLVFLTKTDNENELPFVYHVRVCNGKPWSDWILWNYLLVKFLDSQHLNILVVVDPFFRKLLQKSLTQVRVGVKSGCNRQNV